MVGIVQGLVRMVLNGTMAGGQTWSTSLWLSTDVPTPTPTQDQLNSFALACRDAIQASVVTLSGLLWNASTACTDVTCYWYESNTRKAALVSQPAPITTAGSGQSSMPTFTSLVLSLRSATPGRSGRGRNYMPWTVGGGVSANGQTGSGTTDAVATAWSSALTELNEMTVAWPGAAGQLVVVASFTKGVIHPVVAVVVDSIPDTQHRRTDQLQAVAISTRAVTAPSR